MNWNPWVKYGVIALVVFALVWLVLGGASNWGLAIGASPSKPVVKIGVMLPLSGNMAFIGESMQQSILLAKEQLPPTTRFDYQIVFEDDQLDPTTASTAATKLIQVDQVNALISFSSGIGNVVSPLANENGLLHISTAASDPTVAKGLLNFSHATQPTEEARVLVLEMNKRNLQKLAVLVVNQQGAIAAVNEIKRQFVGTNLSIVFEQVYNRDETHFQTLFQKAEQTKPDLYFVMGFSADEDLLLSQRKELGIVTPITSFETFEFVSKPELIDGMWYVNSAEPNQAFVNQFKAKNNQSPAIYSGNVYDAFNLLVTAYESAGKQVRGKPNPEQAALALLQIKDFNGALGSLSVLPNHLIWSPAVVKEVRNGKFVPVD